MVPILAAPPCCPTWTNNLRAAGGRYQVPDVRFRQQPAGRKCDLHDCCVGGSIHLAVVAGSDGRRHERCLQTRAATRLLMGNVWRESKSSVPELRHAQIAPRWTSPSSVASRTEDGVGCGATARGRRGHRGDSGKAGTGWRLKSSVPCAVGLPDKRAQGSGRDGFGRRRQSSLEAIGA